MLEIGLWGCSSDASGERKQSIVLSFSLCLLLSLCLWTVNITSVSQFFSLSFSETGWLKWAQVGCFPCPTWKMRAGRSSGFLLARVS